MDHVADTGDEEDIVLGSDIKEDPASDVSEPKKAKRRKVTSHARLELLHGICARAEDDHEGGT